MADGLIEAAIAKLSTYGIDASMEGSGAAAGLPDAVVTMRRGGQLARFSIRQDLSGNREFGGDIGTKPLVVRRHIGVSESADLRKRGINFADSAGNAYITFADVYVDVRGNRLARAMNARRAETRVGEVTRVNLFSAKRSQVVFALLTWPQLLAATVREISEVAGVSVGLIQGTLTQLEQDGFLSRGVDPRLLRQGQLFDLWAMTYPQQLAPTLALESFRGAAIDQPELLTGTWLGGENAVPELIRPSSLTIYMEEFNPRVAAVNRWRRDENPNVFIRKKFWAEPFLLDLESQKSTVSDAAVPSTLIYADLLASGEPRQIETAETYRRQDDQLLRIARS